MLGLLTASTPLTAGQTPFHNGPGDEPLLPLPEIRSQDGELHVTLDLKYGAHTIAGKKIWLRGYNSGLAGPVIRARPGGTLNILMVNSLPVNDCNRPGGGHGGHGGHGGGESHGVGDCNKPVNEPHGFNTTNLHTHGLWVSPVGNSDNVLLSLYPGDEFQNEVKVPSDHPPGTHWYHAHHHGSVALQVSSGFVGALIVEGGLDDLPAIAAAREVTLLFQQVSHSKWDCIGEDGKDVRPPELIEAGAGCIASYANFGPGIWPHVKKGGKVDKSEFRYTTINGQAQPTLYARPGEVLRLRTIHAGVRESIHLAIRPPGDARASLQTEDLGDVLRALDEAAGVTSDDRSRHRAIASYLPQVRAVVRFHPLYEVSNDGIAFGRVDEIDKVTLQPGYRSDFLVRFEHPGDYAVIDLPGHG